MKILAEISEIISCDIDEHLLVGETHTAQSVLFTLKGICYFVDSFYVSFKSGLDMHTSYLLSYMIIWFILLCKAVKNRN